MMIVRIMVQIKYFVVIMVRAACLSGTFRSRQLAESRAGAVCYDPRFHIPVLCHVQRVRPATSQCGQASVRQYHDVRHLNVQHGECHLSLKRHVQLRLTVLASQGVLGDFNMDAFYHQDQETWMLALFFILTAMLNIVSRAAPPPLLLIPTASDMCSGCRCC